VVRGKRSRKVNDYKTQKMFVIKWTFTHLVMKTLGLGSLFSVLHYKSTISFIKIAIAIYIIYVESQGWNFIADSRQLAVVRQFEKKYPSPGDPLNVAANLIKIPP
jgi:hypothetical protein